MRVSITIFALPLIVTCVFLPQLVFGQACPAQPQQAEKDWVTEVEGSVAKLGPVHAGEAKVKVRPTTIDLLGKLPEAGRVYLEQMMLASYCFALYQDKTLLPKKRSKMLREYAREVRGTVNQFYQRRATPSKTPKSAPMPVTDKCSSEEVRLEKADKETQKVVARPTDHFWISGPHCILAQPNSQIVKDSVTIEYQRGTDDKAEPHEQWGKVLIDAANIGDSRLCYSLQCRGAPTYNCTMDYKIAWFERKFSSVECRVPPHVPCKVNLNRNFLITQTGNTDVVFKLTEQNGMINGSAKGEDHKINRRFDGTVSGSVSQKGLVHLTVDWHGAIGEYEWTVNPEGHMVDGATFDTEAPGSKAKLSSEARFCE
jgi:hypothetical protein